MKIYIYIYIYIIITQNVCCELFIHAYISKRNPYYQTISGYLGPHYSSLQITIVVIALKGQLQKITSQLKTLRIAQFTFENKICTQTRFQL
jgi:hypothetical protein